MSGARARPTALRDVVVLGGGCYGTFYATQLARAKARGKVAYRRVLVVDREPGCRAARELGPADDRALVTSEWTAFCDAFLGAAADEGARDGSTDAGAADYIVPSPHMPHLMFAWVLRRARARWPGRAVSVTAVPGVIGTPYDRAAADGTRYVSFADWVCPTHCVEPATCPATGGPRDWEMSDAVRALVERDRGSGVPLSGPVLFVCRHHVFGVGTFAVAAVVAGDRVVAAAGDGGRAARVLVGTISSCHGALNVLEVAAAA